MFHMLLVLGQQSWMSSAVMLVLFLQPNKSRQIKKQIKSAIHRTSEDTLSRNRKEHVKATRASDNYPGDVTATIQGKTYSVARGAAATDGAGNIPAHTII